MAKKLTAKGKAALFEVKADIRRAIRRGGRGFDMYQWIELQAPRKPGHRDEYRDDERVRPVDKDKPLEEFCDTVACVAGTLVLNDGWKPVVAQMHEDELRMYYNTTASVFKVKKNGRRTSSIIRVARDILGVSPRAAEELFTAGYLLWHDLNEDNPKDALVAIDRFIKAEGTLSKMNTHYTDRVYGETA